MKSGQVRIRGSHLKVEESKSPQLCLDKIEIMENHSILLSDEIQEVDGVIYFELRSIDRLVLFQNGSEGEKEERVLVHTRSIGDKRYTVKTIVSEAEGSENEETEEECNMTCLEVAAFEEDWNKNWNPSLGQEYTDSENEATEEEVELDFFKKVMRSGRYYE